MLLLKFTVRNYASIRDEISLDFIRPSLRTLKPKPGEAWAEHVYPLAGIFGGNATGKSAILDALSYAFEAIGESATSWQARKAMPRVPFALDGKSANDTSRFVLEFVHADRRHEYGFEIDDSGITREWLRDVPSSRWRTLLNREVDAGKITHHPSVQSLGGVTRRELAMSRALLLDHPQLAVIARDLWDSFDAVSVHDSRNRRLRDIAESLADGSLAFEDIEQILQAADIGIDEVSVHEEELPPRLVEVMRALRIREDEDATLRDGDASGGTQDNLGEEQSEAIVRSLLFQHRGTGEDAPKFPIHWESDGTVAWLALAVSALEILRSGGIFCVDKIDSSLHPHLLDTLLGLFASTEINKRGAQLIFSSHDAYILSPLSNVHLEAEQVWFTDKSFDGATELICLADFPKHPDANVARRYLLGRYGGTPRVAPSAIASLIGE